MKWKTLTDLSRTLDAALNGKLCVQVWLGIGQVLFIGFGDKILPATPRGENHPMPPYEIETGSTDWWIQDQKGILVTSNDERKNVEEIATALVGKKVINWTLKDQYPALWISFEGGFELRMAPYSNGDVSRQDAWILRGPVYYGYVRWDGVMGNGRRDHYLIDEE